MKRTKKVMVFRCSELILPTLLVKYCSDLILNGLYYCFQRPIRKRFSQDFIDAIVCIYIEILIQMLLFYSLYFIILY